jgi:hypothetical protein
MCQIQWLQLTGAMAKVMVLNIVLSAKGFKINVFEPFCEAVPL